MRSPALRLAPALATLACASVTACAGPRVRAEPDRITPGIFLDAPVADAIAREALRAVGPAGLQLTKACEGFVPALYEDAAGYCTIAYGHLVRRARCDGSEPAEFLAGVTEPRGAQLLAVDMGKAEHAVSAAVEVELSEPQYAALCDFVYNVGGENFRRSTLLKVVNAGQLDEVAPQLRRWVMAGGKELKGLRVRREKEIDLFYQGLPRPREGGRALPPVDVRTGE